jgi:hypothetical protein
VRENDWQVTLSGYWRDRVWWGLRELEKKMLILRVNLPLRRVALVARSPGFNGSLDFCGKFLNLSGGTSL